MNDCKYMDEELYITFLETPFETKTRERKKIWNDVRNVKAKKMKKSLWKSIGDFLFGDKNG